jgi:soluble lytic murein transglycosylase-like protein
MNEQTKSSKGHWIPFLTNTAFVIIALSAAAFGGKILYIKMDKIDKTNQLAIANLTESNKRNVLLKLIDTKMDIPIEQKVKLRDTIYDLAYVKEIPLPLICGLIEIESQWNPNAVSEANTKGLFQILPSTARPYLRYERIEYTEKVLFDPIKSTIVGISYLADLHAGHIEAGKNDNDFMLSLHSYFWGSENTKILYSKKDQRNNVPNMSYPIRVLEASKKYKEMGL